MGIVLAVSTSFLILGIWHGAQWTYLAFGGLQALFISYEILTRKKRASWKKKSNPKIYDVLSNILTISIYALSCIFFGVRTMSEGFHFFKNMFSGIGESIIKTLQNQDLARLHYLYLDMESSVFFKALALFALFMLVQRWINSKGLDFLLDKRPILIRWTFYYAIVGMIFFNSNKVVSFLYGTF